MPLKVTCSTCEKTLNVPDAARGKAIRCPGCQSRIAVPAEDDEVLAPAPSPGKAKAKAKKAAVPKAADSEMIFGSLDLRKAADKNARICSKCGFDMKYQDEEDNECPECGFDSSVGGQGARARKKAMKGPDPADFYVGLFTNARKFVAKNVVLAWRTAAYNLIGLLVGVGCLFLYLYIAQWPPRAFLGLCATVAFMTIPGWMWILDVEIIKLTMERKDKIKKLNFDFFLSSAMGFAFIIWCLVAASPIVLVPTMVGYFFLSRTGGPVELIFPVCLALAVLPTIFYMPVVMSHMSMPVQMRGWMLWHIVPVAARNFKPLCVWMLWFLVSNSLSIAGITTVAVLYGEKLVTIAQTMDSNAAIAREEFYRLENPNTKKKGQAEKVLAPLPPKVDVDLKPAIVPLVILSVVCLLNGFTSLFNMRINGLFTYYNRASLNLIDRRKEYKYKAKEQRDDELGEDGPKTPAQLALDSLAIHGVFVLFGLIGGYVYGFTTAPPGQFGEIMVKAVYGGGIGQLIAWGIVYIQCVIFAFKDSPMWGAISLTTFPFGFLVFACQNVKERMEYLLKVAVGIGTTVFLLLLALLIAMTPSGEKKLPEAPAAAAPAEGGGEAKPADGAAPAAAPQAPASQPPAAPKDD